MHALRPLLFSSGLLALLIAVLTGCAAPSSGDMESGDGQYLVRVSPAGRAGDTLGHPASIDTVYLERMLGALRYQEIGLLGRAASRPVFDQDEIIRLAPALSRALAQAAAAQRVDFMSLAGSSASFGNARKTEGTVFVDENGGLNIALSAVRQVMTVDDDFTRFREISLGDPLTVERAMVHLAWEQDTFIPRRQHDGSRYPMWVTTGLDQPDEPVSSLEDAPQPMQHERPAAVSRPAAPPPTDSTARQREVPIEEETSSTSPEAIRERLEFLRSLFEEELISAEDYERERARALRRLD